MLCDKCKQREANVHIQQSINGVTTERNLCSECASKEPGLKMCIRDRVKEAKRL